MKWTETDVIERIRDPYLAVDSVTQSEEWAFLTQVPLRAPGSRDERIIDALAVRCWAGGKGFERIAFEVKVSRADFRNETPEKRAPTEATASRCAYAVPAGLITPTELPPGWGLIEVYETPEDMPRSSRPLGRLAVWRKYAQRREPTCDLDYLVSAGFRRASRAEDAIRRGDVPAAEVARLRHENDRMNGMLSTAKSALRREQGHLQQARSELLAVLGGDQSCADCGEQLTWKREAHGISRWGHKQRKHEGPCAEIRAEQDRLRKVAEYKAEYSWGMAGHPEPRVLRERRLAEQEMETAS